MASEWVHGSGQTGKPRPRSKGKNMKCPKCGTEVTVYSGGVIESHKIYYDAKNKQVYKRTSKYKICDRKKV